MGPWRHAETAMDEKGSNGSLRIKAVACNEMKEQLAPSLVATSRGWPPVFPGTTSHLQIGKTNHGQSLQGDLVQKCSVIVTHYAADAELLPNTNSKVLLQNPSKCVPRLLLLLVVAAAEESSSISSLLVLVEVEYEL